MKDKIEVVFKNDLDISILDKDFYLSLLSVIIDLQQKSKDKNLQP
jgi:hypothetical protein